MYEDCLTISNRLNGVNFNAHHFKKISLLNEKSME